MSGSPAAALARADLGQHLVLGRVDALDVIGQLRVARCRTACSCLTLSCGGTGASTATRTARARSPPRPSACHSSSRRRGGGPPPARALARSGRLSSAQPGRIGFAGVQRDRERRVGALVDACRRRARRARGTAPARRSRRTARCAAPAASPGARAAGVSQRDSPSGFTTSTRRSSAPSTISRLPPTVTVAGRVARRRRRQVARRLLHQRQEARADRQVGPLAIDGRRQQQDPARGRPPRRPARARRSRSAARCAGRAPPAAAPAAGTGRSAPTPAPRPAPGTPPAAGGAGRSGPGARRGADRRSRPPAARRAAAAALRFKPERLRQHRLQRLVPGVDVDAIADRDEQAAAALDVAGRARPPPPALGRATLAMNTTP